MYLSRYPLASTEFRENVEIPQKWSNSAARVNIPWKTVVPSQINAHCNQNGNRKEINTGKLLNT